MLAPYALLIEPDIKSTVAFEGIAMGVIKVN